MQYLSGAFLEPLHQYVKYRGWQWPWSSAPEPGKRYGVKDAEKLWKELLARSDTMYLGYHAGGFLQPRMWPGLSDSLVFCRSLRDGFRMLLNQQAVLAAPNVLSESEQDNMAALIVHWEGVSSEVNQQLTDYTLRCLVLWSCWLRRPDQWITRIELPRADTAVHDTSAYSFFRYALCESGQLSFNNKRGALVLEHSTFEQNLQATQVIPHHDAEDILHKARGAIETGLGHGHLTRRNVADTLCISERTLQRQLAVYGTSYGELLRQVRLHYACRLLRETDRRVLDIALEIGFTDAANLFRLFRSQLNTTPALYRESTRQSA